VAPKGQRPNKVIGCQAKGRTVAQRVAIDKFGIHQRFIQDETHSVSGIIYRS
jgi:polysaccharide pyruvyl transferase WcaK-like protein